MSDRLSDQEVEVAVWEAAKRLGHSRDELDGMLAKAKPREVLKKLEGRRRSANARFEREEKMRWHHDESKKRAEVFAQEQKLNEARLRHQRIETPLSERVSTLLFEAAFVQEGTKGTNYDAKTTSGSVSAPLPSLDGKPLVDIAREILEAAIERAEAEVDRVVRCLPQKEPEDRNAEILKRPGSSALVALRFGVSESLVRKLRSAAGLQAINGYPKKEKK